MAVTIITGDGLAQLRLLPADSVHCVVTSPPYYGLRDYGVAGQIGLEATPDEYVAALVGVFREVRRVLRGDGTVWLNLGDSYAAGGNGIGSGKQLTNVGSWMPPKKPPEGFKPKDLIGIPWMVAFALRADGWWLRQDIIWSKPNPMPESVTDRCTKAHEYLFLLSKSARYWYDAEAIAETQASSGEGGFSNKETLKTVRFKASHATSMVNAENDGLRNRRSVWTVASEPFNGARLMRGAFDGSGRKVSADCPLHGDRSNPASNVQDDGRRAVSRSVRNLGNDSRLAPGLFDALAPTDISRKCTCEQ